MVKYSRSHIKKVNSSFAIESFHQTKKVPQKEAVFSRSALDLGVYLVVPLLVGLGLGIVLDAKLGTKPLCVLYGLLLGGLGSLFNLSKIVQEFSKHA